MRVSHRKLDLHLLAILEHFKAPDSMTDLLVWMKTPQPESVFTERVTIAHQKNRPSKLEAGLQ